MLKQALGIVSLFLIMNGVLAGAPVCLDGACTFEPKGVGQLTVYLLAGDCADHEAVKLLADFFRISPVRELPESIPEGAFLITTGRECSSEKKLVFPRGHILLLKGEEILFREKAYSLSRKDALEELKRDMKESSQGE